MEHFYASIPGWFDFDDIYTQAVQEAADGARLVEVGSWFGRSSAFMAVELANSGKRADFYCVDTWQGSPTESAHQEQVRAHGGSIKSVFLNNMRGLPVIPVEGDSADSASQFEDNSLDFVFIDASHEYHAVSRDIAAWYPKVKPGGVIAGHDVGWTGLFGAVQERIPATEIEVRRSSWWHRKKASGYKLRVPGSHLLFIPVVNRPDLLEKAIASVPSDVALVVVDQSDSGFEKHIPSRVQVVRPSKRLMFSQMQNLMLRIASENGVKRLTFMHSDGSCDPGVVHELLSIAESRQDEWGIMFTHYDVLAAFNVPMLLQRVGFWDETFAWYRSECDYYHRISAAGLLKAQSGLGSRVHHEPSSTIRSSPKEYEAVQAAEKWHKDHYLHKWGGLQGAEVNKIPYVR